MAADIRTTVTKTILKNSLLELMRTTDFSKITIKDICLRSGVSRSTFYSHYEDIYALLADYEKDLFSSFHLEEYFSRLDTDPRFGRQILINILTQAKENADFYRVFFRNMTSGYMERAIAQLSKRLIDYWVDRRYFNNRSDAECFFLFYKAGTMAVVQEWLEQAKGTQKTPEEMADTLSFIMAGAR